MFIERRQNNYGDKGKADGTQGLSTKCYFFTLLIVNNFYQMHGWHSSLGIT